MTLSQSSARLAWLALAGVAVFLAAEFVLDLTAWGQTWDDVSYLEARQLPVAMRDACDTLLRIIRIPFILMAMILIIAIAAARRYVFMGIVTVGAVGAAIVSAEVTKLITPRPDLSPEFTMLVDNAGANTFPSGHATIAAALTIALVIVVSPRWRGWTAAFGFAFTAAISGSTVIAGWHRPSDAIGGVALALAWLAAGGFLLIRFRGVPSPSWPLRWPMLLGGLTALGAVMVVIVLAAGITGSSMRAFVLAEIAIIAWVAVVFASLPMAMKGVDITRPRHK